MVRFVNTKSNLYAYALGGSLNRFFLLNELLALSGLGFFALSYKFRENCVSCLDSED
jgi:hypothetical protein